jgi:hypothetical protein
MLLAPRQRKPGGKKGGFTPWKLNSSSIYECSGALEAVEVWFQDVFGSPVKSQ